MKKNTWPMYWLNWFFLGHKISHPSDDALLLSPWDDIDRLYIDAETIGGG